MPAKFLVLWKLEISRLDAAMMAAVLRQQEHAQKLRAAGKLVERYHIVGTHGGAWIYSVDSHEELDHLLAASPAYNHATYEVLPLAEMEDPTVLRGGEGGA